MPLGKIFLVDDDPEDRDIIKEALALKNAGGMISFAEDGEQALQILDKSFHAGQVPSLIVLDLNMPKLNGSKTLAILKNDHRFHNIPVIIYSTSVNDIEKEKCRSLGAHAYITKPVSYKESLDTADMFLNMCK